MDRPRLVPPRSPLLPRPSRLIVVLPAVPVVDGLFNCYAFRPDSRVLATSTPDGAVQLYETETGRKLQRFTVTVPGAKWIEIFWNPRRSQLLFHAHNDLRLLDLDTGVARPLGLRLPHYGWAAWHPEGRVLAVLDGEGKVHLWDVPNDRLFIPPLDNNTGGG